MLLHDLQSQEMPSPISNLSLALNLSLNLDLDCGLNPSVVSPTLLYNVVIPAPCRGTGQAPAGIQNCYTLLKTGPRLSPG
jgi:hypothetical protein